MSEVDDAIAAARASWARIGDGGSGRPARRRGRRRSGRAGLGTRVALIAAANAILLVAATAIGAAVIPLGLFGALAVLAAMIAVTLAIALAPAAARPTASPARLRQVDLKALPAQTERWLQGQRAVLPAPAQHLIDRIGDRLDTLSPQLGRIEADGELAGEIRRLTGEQLPAFVADYTRVPEPLRQVERNGRTPDAALVDGLAVIDREIGAMTARLAQGDLDSLQTRGRYLQTRYSGDASV